MLMFFSRVNPVEGLYASLPFFLYINASYVGWLLDPIFDFASSDRWTFPYAPKDIGKAFYLPLINTPLTESFSFQARVIPARRETQRHILKALNVSFNTLEKNVSG